MVVGFLTSELEIDDNGKTIEASNKELLRTA
jgi:hypothetical protein